MITNAISDMFFNSKLENYNSLFEKEFKGEVTYELIEEEVGKDADEFLEYLSLVTGESYNSKELVCDFMNRL